MKRTDLKQITSYRGTLHNIPFEIKHWGEDEGINDGKGIWNYYVILPERLVPNFSSLWLETTISKITPESKGFPTHDYYDTWVAREIPWHGGVTFYAKHGDAPGFRAVEFGCDFSHLWDMEAGYPFTLESVLKECIETINQIAQTLALM